MPRLNIQRNINRRERDFRREFIEYMDCALNEPDRQDSNRDELEAIASGFSIIQLSTSIPRR